MPRRAQVLLAEDTASGVYQHLSLAGYEVTAVRDGLRALDLAEVTPFDLILLDTMRSECDGISICRAVRGQGANAHTPILMVNAKGTESDRVLGLESGADDYVTEPSRVRELMARVDALMRRSARGKTPSSRLVRVLDLQLDPDRREALVRGRDVELTRQEFDLVYMMAARPGIVFTREAIIARAWGGNPDVTGRTVDSVVRRLRQKIEQNANEPKLILTAWGSGYKFVDRA